MKRNICLILVILLLTSPIAASAAFAASETDAAAEYLVENGILAGDENGDLMLDKSLTRAELAVILTRLDFAQGDGGLADWQEWGEARFSDPENRYNSFTDLPDWALPYIEYCYQRSLMNGVGDNKFDPQGKVNPKMACTVMLRYCGISETDWDYSTSVDKAKSLGLAPSEGVDGDIILRGAMAAVIYRGMKYAQDGEQIPITPPVTPPVQETPPIPSESEAPVMTIEEMKAEIVRLTNVERVNAGLPELSVLPELMDSAQAKAQDFFDSHYYGHNSPIYGTPGEMIKKFVPNAKTAAENIAPWTKTPAEAFAGWVESSEHYDIILTERLTHIGVGIVEGADGGYWWVQHFVRL